MVKIVELPLPDHSLMADAGGPGSYVDCYATSVPDFVDLSAFLRAFYGSRLFAAERAILRLAMGAGATPAQIEALALGDVETFAAWTVTARGPDQIWLTDRMGHTASFLAVEALPTGGTRLLFGPLVHGVDGRLPWLARVLMPFHRRYARALLAAAARGLA